MPTNSKGGMTQDSSVVSALLVGTLLYCTPCLASSPARPGGTCTVLNAVFPSGIFSVSVPWMTSPDTVTCFTFPVSRYCWNWLYGITSDPPSPPPPDPNRPNTVTTSNPRKISQTAEGSCGFGAGTGCLLSRPATMPMDRQGMQQSRVPVRFPSHSPARDGARQPVSLMGPSLPPPV